MPIRKGRPRHTDAPVQWKLSLPGSLVATIEVLLSDPLTGSARYGSRSKLIEHLLREWVDTQRKHSKNVVDNSTATCHDQHSTDTFIQEPKP